MRPTQPVAPEVGVTDLGRLTRRERADEGLRERPLVLAELLAGQAHALGLQERAKRGGPEPPAARIIPPRLLKQGLGQPLVEGCRGEPREALRLLGEKPDVCWRQRPQVRWRRVQTA